jgi:phospholipid-translocating ATPase
VLNYLVGFIATYIAPLAFVLSVTMGKEAYDDYQRHLRDKEANSFRYLTLNRGLRLEDIDNAEDLAGTPLTKAIPAARIKAGDLVVLEKNMRVPADMVLLKTTENSGTGETPASRKSFNASLTDNGLVDVNGPAKIPSGASLNTEEEEGGSCFVRTDQLDGETDWKLKVAVARTQKLSNRELLGMAGELYGEFDG